MTASWAPLQDRPSPIRAGTVTGYGVHLGAYVETKNSTMDDSHREPPDLHRRLRRGQGLQLRLRHRHQQLRRPGQIPLPIGDYAFIGCNANLVAPVKVGDGLLRGRTITGDVPAGRWALPASARAQRRLGEPRLAA